jgi:hypothetical protein
MSRHHPLRDANPMSSPVARGAEPEARSCLVIRPEDCAMPRDGSPPGEIWCELVTTALAQIGPGIWVEGAHDAGPQVRKQVQ